MDFRLYIWPRKAHRLTRMQYALEWFGDCSRSISLTWTEGVILSRLYHGPADLVALTDALYSDREDGGPDDPDNVIAVTICRLKKKLQDSPINIGHVWGKEYFIQRMAATIDRISDTIIDEGMENPPVAPKGKS